MDPGSKSQFWMFVGLTADGKNVEVSREDSVLKEGPPMVGNCSYGEACQVTAPQARWPYVCAQPGCKAYVDLMCCDQYVDCLKDQVRDSPHSLGELVGVLSLLPAVSYTHLTLPTSDLV